MFDAMLLGCYTRPRSGEIGNNNRNVAFYAVNDKYVNIYLRQFRC